MAKQPNGLTLDQKAQNLVYGIIAQSGLQERLQEGIKQLAAEAAYEAVQQVQATVARALGVNGYAKAEKSKQVRPSRAKTDKAPSKKDKIRVFLEEHRGQLFSAEDIATKALGGDTKHIVQLVNTVKGLKRQVAPNPTGGPARRIYGL